MSEENTTITSPRASLKNSLGIPVAIVIAAGLIAGAIYFSSQKTEQQALNVQNSIDSANKAQQTPEYVVAPVQTTDHIKGNPNAPIVIVEYSDFDCPYCKIFHETMNKIMNKYGADGNVAWVYRQFPIKQLHPNALKVAEASECVAEIGGNEAFWKFTDAAYASRKNVTLANGGQTIGPVDVNSLADLATQAGVDRTQFETCLTEGRHTETITQAVQAAVKAGAEGTPYSVIMAGNEKGVINGAQSFEYVDGVVENLIQQLKTIESN
jgi:protein-disulfide isomerase